MFESSSGQGEQRNGFTAKLERAGVPHLQLSPLAGFSLPLPLLSHGTSLRFLPASLRAPLPTTTPVSARMLLQEKGAGTSRFQQKYRKIAPFIWILNIQRYSTKLVHGGHCPLGLDPALQLTAWTRQSEWHCAAIALRAGSHCDRQTSIPPPLSPCS